MIPILRPYAPSDLPAMIALWNEIVVEGQAFPQEETLNLETGTAFFASQTHCGLAIHPETQDLLGLYILHPNNVGRCGHLSNASYAVSPKHRGLHIGTVLVQDSMHRAKEAGFLILQFNAVVVSNHSARVLYERLGFVPLGIIPQGFRNKAGILEDICPYYIAL